jgi:hypothetical protein
MQAQWAPDPNNPPLIQTDRPDYAPGEFVTFSGAGWYPDETFAITLHEEPELNEDVVLWAVADANGNFTNTDFIVQGHHLGVTFWVTATGQTSGLEAITAFTDSLTNIFPKKTVVGSAGIGMTVTGSGFAIGAPGCAPGAACSKVQFGTNQYSPDAASSTASKLNVTIPASEFTAAGTVAVTVVGAGAPASAPFFINFTIVNNTYLVDSTGTGGAYTTIQAAAVDMPDHGPWNVPGNRGPTRRSRRPTIRRLNLPTIPVTIHAAWSSMVEQVRQP